MAKTFKRNGIKSFYEYRVRVGTVIANMVPDVSERYAREFARHVLKMGANSATVDRRLVGGGYALPWKHLTTYNRKKGR